MYVLPVYTNIAMSVKKTTTASHPPRSPRLRLSAHANIVLRERCLAKNAAGTIIETPKQLFWRVATDIARAKRLYPSAGRLPQAAQRWYEPRRRKPKSLRPFSLPTDSDAKASPSIGQEAGTGKSFLATPCIPAKARRSHAKFLNKIDSTGSW